MKRSKNTVKNKLIATLMFGITITGNAITSDVSAMYSSNLDALEEYRLVCPLSEKELTEIQQVIKAILSMLIEPSRGNVAFVKKLYGRTTDRTIAELLYHYLLDIKDKQKLPILSDLQVPMNTRYSNLSRWSGSLERIISVMLEVKSNSSNIDEDYLISFYNCSDFVEQTIMYGQLIDLSEDNRCALHVISSIGVPVPRLKW